MGYNGVATLNIGNRIQAGESGDSKHDNNIWRATRLVAYGAERGGGWEVKAQDGMRGARHRCRVVCVCVSAPPIVYRLLPLPEMHAHAEPWKRPDASLHMHAHTRTHVNWSPTGKPPNTTWGSMGAWKALRHSVYLRGRACVCICVCRGEIILFQSRRNPEPAHRDRSAERSGAAQGGAPRMMAVPCPSCAPPQHQQPQPPPHAPVCEAVLGRHAAGRAGGPGLGAAWVGAGVYFMGGHGVCAYVHTVDCMPTPHTHTHTCTNTRGCPNTRPPF